MLRQRKYNENNFKKMQKKLNKIANDTNLFLKILLKQKKSELMIPMKYDYFQGKKKVKFSWDII